MTNLYELKLGAEKLEALQVLLGDITQITEAIEKTDLKEIIGIRDKVAADKLLTEDYKSKALEALDAVLALKAGIAQDKKDTLAAKTTAEAYAAQSSADKVLVDNAKQEVLKAKKEVDDNKTLVTTAKGEVDATKVNIDGVYKNIQSIDESIGNKETTIRELIGAFSQTINFKGIVATYADLPSDPEVGDMYKIADTKSLYMWDSLAWQKIDGNINVEQFLLKTDFEKAKQGFVKNSGSETIAGAKKFTDNITLEKATPALEIINSTNSKKWIIGVDSSALTIKENNGGTNRLVLNPTGNLKFDKNIEAVKFIGTATNADKLDGKDSTDFRLVADSYTKTESDGKYLGKKDKAVAIEGFYTADGGVVKPKDVGTHIGKLHMMDIGRIIPGFKNYADWMLLNGYSDSDVPFRTGIGVEKTDKNPKGFLISAGSTSDTWTGKSQIVTDKNGIAFDSARFSGKKVDEFMHNTLVLPKGDYNTREFWDTLKSGAYYYRDTGGTNAPSAYGAILVLGDNAHEKNVFWCAQPTHNIYHWSQNYNSNVGWVQLVTSNHLSVNSSNDTIVKRDSKGSIYGHHFNSDVPAEEHTANANSLMMFANADGFLRKMNLKTLSNLLAPLNNFESSKGARGYIKFPGGIIMQWGNEHLMDDHTYVFPIAFPNACQILQINEKNTIAGLSGRSIGVARTDLLTKASFKALSVNAPCHWFAIGY